MSTVTYYAIIDEVSNPEGPFGVIRRVKREDGQAMKCSRGI